MPIPVDSSLILVDSSGFQWNPVIPAGMVGGVTSTDNDENGPKRRATHIIWALGEIFFFFHCIFLN